MFKIYVIHFKLDNKKQLKILLFLIFELIFILFVLFKASPGAVVAIIPSKRGNQATDDMKYGDGSKVARSSRGFSFLLAYAAATGVYR